MKNLIIIAFCFIFFSCTNETPTPQLPSIPMVKTEELKSFTHGNLATHTKNTYTYDTQQRVVSVAVQNVLTNATNTITYDYTTPNQVKEINSNFTKTYLLGATGRATQASSNPLFVVNNTYDSNGCIQTSTDSQYNFTYTYTNNNLTELKTIYITGGTLAGLEKLSYGTQPNTIGNENKGMKFLGKSSVNFLTGKQQVAGSPLYSYTYTSNYDTQNRLTDYYWSRIGGNQGATFQAFYTYYP